MLSIVGELGDRSSMSRHTRLRMLGWFAIHSLQTDFGVHLQNIMMERIAKFNSSRRSSLNHGFALVGKTAASSGLSFCVEDGLIVTKCFDLIVDMLFMISAVAKLLTL